MAKIGYIMLNEGKWKDHQIISQDWIDQSTVERNLQYGYLWWFFPVRKDNIWHKSIVAAGAGGQRIYSIPDLQTVVAITAGYYDSPLGGQYAHEIIQDYIVPSMISK
jgi:CubicO group peptidase (beta-lactamase class C family)